jgi:hypothetical protein
MAVAKKLYYSTDDIKARFKPSLSNYFDVFIDAGFDGINSGLNNEINFLAYEAVLPGTSYQTTEVFGDRQGITETFANKRVYPPVDVSFYIDYDYNVLRFFESWMKYISPNLGKDGSTDSYQKFKYPQNNYKKEIIITKFERNFRQQDQRLVKGGIYNQPINRCTYRLKNAYPVNLISVPVSYEGSNLLRTTVTFNYDVYSFSNRENDEINRPSGDGSSIRGPGGDSGITLGDLNRQVRLINENLPEQRVTSIPPTFG